MLLLTRRVSGYGVNVSGQFNGQWSLPGEFNTHKHPFQLRKKTSSLDEVLSICKLQQHFVPHRCRYTHTNSKLSLPLEWYLKVTILVDLYGPLKLVLIFAASTAPRHCALNTLHSGEKNYFKWSETLEKRQLSFCKTKSMLYIYKLFI